MNNTDYRMQNQVLIKEIAHTMLHRMSLWQFIFKGGVWRRQYDEACQAIADLNKEEGK